MDKIWSAIKNIFGSGDGKGVIGSINEVVDTYVTTKEDRHEMKMAMRQAVHEKELEAQQLALQAKAEFNQRIKDLEGTAKDLLQAGFPGRVILFLRGAQRPIWGFGLMYADFKYLSGGWEFAETSRAGDILWLINLLVLTFLFGERAIKNAAPFIEKIKRSK